MSFQLFISDIKKEPLTTKRLQDVWEFYNLKNKSPLIDKLSRSLFIEFQKRTGDNISFSPEEVDTMCKKFCNILVRKLIPPQKILLEPLPLSNNSNYANWLYNPNTSIVFRPKTTDVVADKKEGNPSEWIAVRVLKSNKLYPLRLAHLNICITNGWFFETDIQSISSPFKV